MTLTQLRYLVAVADNHHFGKAAEACAISQPTLSAQLRKLERELEAQLIERGAKIALTALGEAVVARARTILLHADEIRSVTKGADAPLIGPRRIGIIPTLCPYMLPRVLPVINQAYPRLDLICREALTDDVLSAVKCRSLDWALVAEEPEDKCLRGKVLFKEPFLAALPPGHPLASASRVQQKDLPGTRVLVLQEGHCLRDQALAICTDREPTGDDLQATSLETLRGLVAAGQGVTLLPALSRRDFELGIVLRPLDPPAGRVIYLVHRRSDPRRDDIDLLARIMRRQIVGAEASEDSLGGCDRENLSGAAEESNVIGSAVELAL